MNNYCDTFVKPEYIHYFILNVSNNVRNPVKLDYSKKYKKSIKNFSISIDIIIKNNNIRYTWTTDGDIQDDLLYPMINNRFSLHIKKTLEYLKTNNIKVYSYIISNIYDIGLIIGVNGRNKRYLENRIAQLCKCRSIPRVNVQTSNNILNIHFINQHNFDKNQLDDIIDEYLMDFTVFT